MTNILSGVFTNQGRLTLAKSFGYIGTGITTHAAYFKIGEGGYLVTPQGNVPISPQEGIGFLDIQAVTLGYYYYQQSLVPVDLTLLSPSIMQVRCRIDEDQANDDGNGKNPIFYELGVFDQNDNLMVYCTFSAQTKSVGKILTNLVQVVF